MDKIDETLDELKKEKKKKKLDPSIALIPPSGGLLLWNETQKKETVEPEIDILKITAEEFSRVISEDIDEEIGTSIKSYVDNNIKQIGVRDTYLPYVLTRIKVCGNNTDARRLITDGKVKINNSVMKFTYVTKQLSNFLLEVNGEKWEIFKID